MEATLLQVLPVFAIVAAGYLAGRFRYLPENLFDGLMRFVLSVAAPLYVFRALARSSLLDKAPGNLAEFLAVYFLGAALAMVAGLVVAQYVFKSPPAEQMRMAVAGSHSSAVVLGIPAVTLILGSQAITPLALLVGLHGMAMALLVTIAAGLRRKSGDLMQDSAQALLAQAKTPIFIAAAAGVAFAKLDVSLPGAVDRTLQMVAVAGVPCGLFALGGLLLPYRLGDRPQFEFATAAVKLVAHPLIIWLIAAKFKLIAIPASWVPAAMIVAAMPVGFEMMMAGKRAKGEVPGGAILVSTGLAVITVTIATHLIRAA
jgi:predicted permease